MLWFSNAFGMSPLKSQLPRSTQSVPMLQATKSMTSMPSGASFFPGHGRVITSFPFPPNARIASAVCFEVSFAERVSYPKVIRVPADFAAATILE